MHPVLNVIRNRLAGQPCGAKLAIVARGGGQRWVVAAGITMLLKALKIEADIIGGTSGGGLATLFYADQGCINRAMIVRSLSQFGFDRTKKHLFICAKRLLRGQPPMDINGLIDDAFTLRYPVLWDNLVNSPKPIFLTATQRDGTAVVQRLDKSSVPFCKAAAKNTARIPFIAHSQYDQNVLWDGGLSNDVPIDEAFSLGASHVLVINPAGANQTHEKSSSVEKYLLAPILKYSAPDLYHLLVTREQKVIATLSKYANSSNVYQLQLPVVHVQNTTTDEKTLAAGVQAGWHYAAQVLGLAKPPPYPPGWVPVFAEHGLI